MKQQAQETKQYMDIQEVEEQKLQKIIADADAEKVSLKKELDQVRQKEKGVCGCVFRFCFSSHPFAMLKRCQVQSFQ